MRLYPFIRQSTFCFILALALPFHSAAGSVARSDVDEAIRAMPAAKSPAEVAKFIAALTTDQGERAQGVYTWIAENIAYDTEAYFNGTEAITDAEGVFRTRKTVCEGYSELYAHLAGKLDLEVIKVVGYAKSYSYHYNDRFSQPNHTWNAVSISGNWHLLDTTWGAGHLDGRDFVKKFNDAWFAMDPRLFAINHYPVNGRWLLFHTDMTLSDYERAPFIKTYDLPDLIEAGFPPADILDLAKKPLLPELIGPYSRTFTTIGGNPSDLLAFIQRGTMPSVWQYPGVSIGVVDFPRKGELQIGETYRFAVTIPDCESVAVICGDDFNILHRNGDVFSGDVKVTAGEVSFSAKILHKGSLAYWPIMLYRAK